MNISYAQFLKEKNDDGSIVEGAENNGIEATIDGIIMFVPLIEANRHYAEIMRQVADGTLTIQDAN